MFAFAPAYPSRTDLDWCWYLRKQGAMGEAVERILHDIGVMNPGGWADWKASTLTNTGAPVAMNFTYDKSALELTTEVADPGDDPTNRVSHVCALLERLGGTAPSAALRDVISTAQSEANLRYGARLGLRKSKTDLQTTLYAELPAAAADLSGLMSSVNFKPVLDDLGDAARTTMLGFNGTTGQVTLYWLVEDADRSVLPKLTAPTDVDPQSLSATIDKIAEGTPADALPCRKMGFSYAATGPDAAPELSLYFSAQGLFGNDAAIEKRVKSCSADRLIGYSQLMEILNPAPRGQTHHGLITMTGQKNTSPALSISVAAAYHCPFETM
ncbi:hypothetical protein [Yoonia sp. BS5-3]|uniref:Uncharacterized protein n=1 Tax=Yoonia phaeophyticola TaxID=3137369 RepID=A0ABZ2V596_9RHOB